MVMKSLLPAFTVQTRTAPRTMGVALPSGDTGQYLETFWVVTT
jgi:hypothetical protein